MLSYNKYNNAIILPVIKNDGHRFIGGIYCNKKYINESHLYTHAPYIEADNIINESVIFGGMLFNHYGHFLLESLSRIWYIKEHPEIPVCWTLAWDYNPPINKWQQEIFDILEIKNKNIILTNSTQFDSVIVPFPGYIHGKRFISDYHVKKLGIYSYSKKDIDKLYISRTKIPKNCGGFDNELELEEILKERGWEIFHPQEHSVKQQLYKIASSKIVFGVESSAFHSLVLMKNISTKFITFSKSESTIATYHIIAQAKNIDYTTLDINKKIKNTYLYSPLNRYDLDIVQLKKILEITKDFSYCDILDNYKIKKQYTTISYKEAKELLDKIKPCSLEEECYYKSVIYKKNNKIREAKNEIFNFIKNENVSSMLLSHYCKLLVESGDIDNILELTTKIITKQKHWIPSFPINLSNLCLKKRYYDLAEKILNLTLENCPNNFLIYHKISLVYNGKKQFDKALYYARIAFNLNKTDMNLATHLSNFLRWTKKYEEAKEFITKFLIEYPTWTEGYRQLSYIERDLGNIEDAICLAKKSIELTPNKIYYGDYLCNLLCKKKDFTTVIEVAQKTLIKNSEQAWAYNQIANAYYEIGNFNLAKINIEKAINLDCNNKNYISFYNKIKKS